MEHDDLELEELETGFRVWSNQEALAFFGSASIEEFERCVTPNERFVRAFVRRSVNNEEHLTDRELDELSLELTIALMAEHDRSDWPLTITEFDLATARIEIRRLAERIAGDDRGRAMRLGASLANVSADEYASWCERRDERLGGQ